MHIACFSGCPFSISIEEAGEKVTEDVCTGGPREQKLLVSTTQQALVYFR